MKSCGEPLRDEVKHQGQEPRQVPILRKEKGKRDLVLIDHEAQTREPRLGFRKFADINARD